MAGPLPPSRRQASPAAATRSVKSAAAVAGRLPGVAEAHQVGDPPVPEEHGHLPVAGRHAPRAVERQGPGARGRKRPQQHRLVGRGPGHPLGRQHLEGLGRDRPLGRPHPGGGATEAAGVARQRVGGLAARVVRPGEPRRQRHAGERPGRHVGVADQRQDGVVVRRGGELHLAARRRAPASGAAPRRARAAGPPGRAPRRRPRSRARGRRARAAPGRRPAPRSPSRPG